MSSTEPVPGVIVDFDPDTEDITLVARADEWEALANAYADATCCAGCMWHEAGWNPYNNTRWRECSCFDPRACPAVNPRAVANALRRQAS